MVDYGAVNEFEVAALAIIHVYQAPLSHKCGGNIRGYPFVRKSGQVINNGGASMEGACLYPFGNSDLDRSTAAVQVQCAEPASLTQVPDSSSSKIARPIWTLVDANIQYK